MVVVEHYDHAKARGAKIYAEVLGYGLSGDAYHITAPAPDGDGGYRAMSAAIKRAGISAGEVDYINAHGTSTPKGDEIELSAITGEIHRHHFADVLEAIDMIRARDYPARGDV